MPGVVFCAPFAEEKLWAHRVFVNFAQVMAEKGYTVLRFDQMGHGDSSGDHEDMTLETYMNDVKTAADYLRLNCHTEHVGLLGLRWGATVAALSAVKTRAEFLILWDPVVKGSDYIQQCLRSNIATQLMIHRKVVKNRDKLVEELLSGISVNIDGYLISSEFYVQATAVNLLEKSVMTGIPALITRTRKGQTGKNSSDLEQLFQIYASSQPLSAYREIQGEPFWTELKTYLQYPEALFTETLSWVKHISQSPSQPVYFNTPS